MEEGNVSGGDKSQGAGAIDYGRKLDQCVPQQTVSACMIVKDAEATLWEVTSLDKLQRRDVQAAGRARIRVIVARDDIQLRVVHVQLGVVAGAAEIDVDDLVRQWRVHVDHIRGRAPRVGTGLIIVVVEAGGGPCVVVRDRRDDRGVQDGVTALTDNLGIRRRRLVEGDRLVP